MFFIVDVEYADEENHEIKTDVVVTWAECCSEAVINCESYYGKDLIESIICKPVTNNAVLRIGGTAAQDIVNDEMNCFW